MPQFYHTNSTNPPSDCISAEQFEARIATILPRIGRILRACYSINHNPDDLDDAQQEGSMLLWITYTQDPTFIHADDHLWLKVGMRGAKRALKRQRTVNRRHTPVSSFNPDEDMEEFEGLERISARRSTTPRRTEAERADKRIDLERWLTAALEKVNRRYRAPLRTLIPHIAQGYLLREAARECGIDRTRAQRMWRQLCNAIHELSREEASNHKGKGCPATAEEYETIRILAAQGVSLKNIARQLGRRKQFVLAHFERATGYRRSTLNPIKHITPDQVAQMRMLRAQGLSYTAIAQQVGCSASSICAWLKA
jgi:hypothetical protein